MGKRLSEEENVSSYKRSFEKKLLLDLLALVLGELHQLMGDRPSYLQFELLSHFSLDDTLLKNGISA